MVGTVRCAVHSARDIGPLFLPVLMLLIIIMIIIGQRAGPHCALDYDYEHEHD
jgi:hypothetical protein